MRTKILFAVAVCACVSVCVSSCSTVRTVAYGRPEIDDYKIFHSVEVLPSEKPFTFHEGAPETRRTVADFIVKATRWYDADTLDMPLGEYLENSSATVAFLVIRNDSILFEEYYKGYDRTTICSVFSISKSVTSLLTGIAVDEGYIESVHDPVTKYIPELAKKDPHFERLTIEHLLDMRSGFDFDEDNQRLFAKAPRLYYGTSYLGQMKRMKFAAEPGSGNRYNYQSATTAMLGLVVQRATGKNLAEYLQEKVWMPMGMENRATWSVDGRRHRMAKADCGLNTTARDLAKIGRLYLHGGDWNGTPIVDREWVTRSTVPNPANGGYQYQWYSMNGSTGTPDDSYYAVGIMKQVLVVDPAKNLVIVRLGERGDKEWVSVIENLTKVL